MIQAFFNGVVLGFLLTILIGPIFFALIETSIRKGVYFGIQLAIGVVLSDAFYIVVTYAGLAKLLDNPQFKNILGIVGGSIMIIVGMSALLKKQFNTRNAKDIEMSIHQYIKNIFKGFVLNTMNPAVLLFWIGAVSYVTVDLKYNMAQVLLFFLGTITTTFSTDIGKIYIANQLSKIMTDKIILWFNRIAGLGLTLFGLKLIYEVALPNF
jgi:threonine/homoserine/homoserine lactone efflux protein